MEAAVGYGAFPAFHNMRIDCFLFFVEDGVFVTHRGPIGIVTGMDFKSNIQNKWLRAGFTLVELLIAVALIGILLVIGIPNLETQLPRARLDSALWAMSSRLQMARTQAMSEGGRVHLSFNSSQNEYTFWSDSKPRDLAKTYKFSHSSSIRMSAYPPEGGSFRPDGAYESTHYGQNLGYIWMWADGAAEQRWILVLPSGQISTYSHSY